MTVVSERVQRYRSRMRDEGFRSVQMWIPDPRRDEFIQEAARQSALVAQADRDGDDQDFIEAVSISWED